MNDNRKSLNELAEEILKTLPEDASEEDILKAIDDQLGAPIEVLDFLDDERLQEPIPVSKKVFMGKSLPSYADDYYDLIERMPFMESDDVDLELLELCRASPEYLDPTITLAEHCFRTGKQEMGEQLTASALAMVLEMIVDKKGRWPAKLEWLFFENRHLLRALTNAAYTFWALEERGLATTIFTQVLRMNPHDNQGIRFCLAAVLDGVSLKAYAESMNSADWLTPTLIDRVTRMTNLHPDRFPIVEEEE